MLLVIAILIVIMMWETLVGLKLEHYQHLIYQVILTHLAQLLLEVIIITNTLINML